MSAFAREEERAIAGWRERGREESVQRERVSAKSDSQLVVAHINACHGYLTREDMWVGQGVIVDLVSGSFSFDRGERAENLPDLIFLRSDNFGSSCSLCFCVSRSRARIVSWKPIVEKYNARPRDATFCTTRRSARSNVATFKCVRVPNTLALGNYVSRVRNDDIADISFFKSSIF